MVVVGLMAFEFLEVMLQLLLQVLNLFLDVLNTASLAIVAPSSMTWRAKCRSRCCTQKGERNEWNVETHGYDYANKLHQ